MVPSSSTHFVSPFDSKKFRRNFLPVKSRLLTPLKLAYHSSKHDLQNFGLRPADSDSRQLYTFFRFALLQPLGARLSRGNPACRFPEQPPVGRRRFWALFLRVRRRTFVPAR